jgi:hypothetical protein
VTDPIGLHRWSHRCIMEAKMNINQKTKHNVRRLTVEDRRRCWRRLDQLWDRHHQLVAAKADLQPLASSLQPEAPLLPDEHINPTSGVSCNVIQ